MIAFVNAKINLGLNIVARREDGYHLLQTVFYPVGKHNGTPENPEPFCDIIEAEKIHTGTSGVESTGNVYEFRGRELDCPMEKNLVYRAAEKMTAETGLSFSVSLVKHLPDGAGLGGGSADAAFTLRTLNTLAGAPLSDDRLREMALSLGADCPFFITDVPAYAEGIGETLQPVEAALEGKWCVIVKPDVYVSTREAFAGITPCRPAISPLEAYLRPIEEWRQLMGNDFEKTIFAVHPRLAEIKSAVYDSGALYAQMSGSGSSIFGIYCDRASAEAAARTLGPHGRIYISLL